VSRNKISGLKVSRGEFRDEISSLAAILLSNDIRRGVNMLLLPRNKVSVGRSLRGRKSLHVQSRVTISTDGNFSEGDTLLLDTGCGCALLLRAPYGKFGLI